MEDTRYIRSLSNGVNQKGVRDHNERLILSLLQRNGEMPGSEIARQTELSAQTVSVILRKLVGDGLVLKGKPVKGRVGKPSVPIRLNPKGAATLGCKIGRRSSEVCLTDLAGNALLERRLHYDIALPKTIFDFIERAVEAALDALGPLHAADLCGIGIAVPFEIWKWGASDGNTPPEFLSWKDVSFPDEVARFTDLPVFVVNDASGACWAEHVYGHGREIGHYAYFFVSTFIGGGVVLNRSVYEGPQGNAGAFGPLRIGDREGQTRQLLEVASIHVLESAVAQAGHDPRDLWVQPQNWDAFAPLVDEWIEDTAHAMAQACVSVCAVIDFEAMVIDGYFPDDIKARLVDRVRAYLPLEDSRGLVLPEILPGIVGTNARAIGAACIPMFAQYFLSAKVLMSD